MVKIKYTSGGRTVSQRQFFDNIKQKGIDLAFAKLEELVHGAAASIVDPETGKHAAVFVRRRPNNEGHIIRTQGSPAFARELEKRLGVDAGTVMTMTPEQPAIPYVYLAHASEDHEKLAKPLAKKLLAKGIEVWLDGWEIGSGDSLRQKMEEGLAGCTHFVVLLTPKSLGKKWVETEIDAGFVRAVEGEARFIGIRVGVAIDQLSPFLKSRRCPQIDVSDEAAVDALISELHGVSNKPPRGPKPRYVQTIPAGIPGWATTAVAVAEYLVRNSKNGTIFDPQTTIAQTAEATGLSEEDVRLGVLDLSDRGLIERSNTIGSDRFWPKLGLFVEFDEHFMGWKPEEDAVLVANYLVSTGEHMVKLDDAFASNFPEWSVRRLNAALAYLEGSKAVETSKALAQNPFIAFRISVTDRTRRFVRDHG